jgi:hypothetical protein
MPAKPRPSWAPDFRHNLAAGLRFVLFRRVRRRDFRVGVEPAIVLLLFSAMLLCAVDLARVGLHSTFNRYAIPYLVFTMTLGLTAWYLLARWQGRPRQVLPMLIMSAAVAPVFYLVEIVLALGGRGASADLASAAVIAYWLLVGWYLVTVFRIIAWHWRKSWVAHAVGTTGYALLTIVPLYLVPYQYFWRPVYDDEREPAPQVNAEQVFYAQHDLVARAERQLRRQRPGVTDIYFVGFGAYADEDVFMKEVHVIRELLDTRFDTAGRSALLINNPKTVADTPIASVTNLARLLKRIGRTMDRDQDVLVLYITSHGSPEHQLAVDFWPLELNGLDPDVLKRTLDESGIRWKVVIVSACYSGGFIDRLRDAHTLVMTSSDARHQSFGCGATSDFTYFGQALFDMALRRTHSFPQAFQDAERRIAARERRERREPSNPQLASSPAIDAKLARLARELDRRIPAGRTPPPAVTAGGVEGGAACEPEDCGESR